MFESVGGPGLWIAFLSGILVLLALDLGLFNRGARTISVPAALGWSVAWVALSLLFNAFVWHRFGARPGLEFLSAYLIEKSLSVDNLFVFLVIFRYMGVRPQVMHRVLFAGIVGALLLRAIFIIAGIGLIESFSWTLYVFGGFLLFTGVKLLLPGNEQFDPSENFAYRLARRFLPFTHGYRGDRFFVREDGRIQATPLLLVLLMIETSDVVFALDSIPAVFGISRDPFIVFTSNVCAVLGLRAMYFLLQHVLDRLAYLKYGLGLVLAYIGAKMMIELGLMGLIEPVHIPIGVSLATVAGLLGLSALASLILPRPATPKLEELESDAKSSLVADIPPSTASMSPTSSMSTGAPTRSAFDLPRDPQ